MRSGAFSHSMGPFAHAAVPTGVLASQMPSEMRAACDGKCSSPFFRESPTSQM